MKKQKLNGLESLGGLVYSTNPDAFVPQDNTAPAEPVNPGTQLLYVSLDRRQRAGKSVTLIEGFMGPEDQLEALGKALKTRCGTGGSVKDGCILIQGDVREKAILFLSSQGYKTKRKGG
jgi:translation initiation factor 1